MGIILKFNLKIRYWIIIAFAVIAIPFIHTNNQFLAENEAKKAEKIISDEKRFVEYDAIQEEKSQKAQAATAMKEKVNEAVTNDVDVNTSDAASCMEIASTVAEGDFDAYKKALEECEN